MKPVLAAAAGFTLSLGMFAGGAVLATYTLTAKPVGDQVGPTQDVAALWTLEPKPVDPDAQDLERIAAAPLPPEPKVAERSARGPAEVEEITIASADPDAWPQDGMDVDQSTTSAIRAPQDMPAEEVAGARLPAAHVQWCADRYRSYRIETNSYTPYSGGQKSCVSPYSGQDETTASAEFAQVAMTSDKQTGAYAIASTTGRHVEMASRHVQSCFDRYRSYRPEDNSYQPYGGGPRQQCR